MSAYPEGNQLREVSGSRSEHGGQFPWWLATADELNAGRIT